MSMERTQKVCTRGHQMQPDWDVCPYCPSPSASGGGGAQGGSAQGGGNGGGGGHAPGGNPALARTVRMDATEIRAAAPVAPAVAPAAAAPAPPPPPRKTEIFERPPQIQGIAWLVGATGSERGRTHRIDRERAVAGASSGCDIVLSGDHVSEQHASFRFQERHFVVTDLDSTNGTSVNGEAVQQRVLADGDRLTLGGGEWIFKCVVFEDA